MSNQNKVEIVNSLTQKMGDASAVYFTCYTGIDVSQMTTLRKKFRDSGVDYFISKNTLTKIAAKNAGFEDKLDAFLQGQIGVAYSGADPVSPARVIKDFRKENKELLEVVGLVFEGEVYDGGKYKELADLPSREELLAKFIGGLSQPMTKIVGTLGGAMSKFVGVLASLKENKS